MQARVEKEIRSRFDYVKWSVSVVLILLGFGANYYFVQVPLALRLVGWVVLCCLVLLIAFQTAQGKRLWKFIRESKAEVRKVVWPTRQETFQTTLIVIAIVIVFALVMWGADSFLMWAVSWLTGQRG